MKSADELEAEDREAQEAKLQELIRRGTPRDLAAAQELMKTLAGANPDAKPDYRTQALNELNKLESKVILLNEILDNVDTARGERFAQGDVYDVSVLAIRTYHRTELINRNAHIASCINTEGRAAKDPEMDLKCRERRPRIPQCVPFWLPIRVKTTLTGRRADLFLQINDQINTVLNRYEAYKKGDFSAASNPIPPELSNGASGSGPQAVSLIDFDDAPSQPAQPSGGIDDLASLFASAPTQAAPSIPAAAPGHGMYGGPMGAMGLGMNMNMMTSAPATPAYQSPQPAPSQSASNSTRAGTVSPPTGLGSIRLGTPQLQAQSPPLHHTQSTPGFYGAGQPQYQQPQYQQPPSQQQLFQQQQFQQSMQPQQPQQPVAPPAGQAQGKDPFADLVGLF